MCGGGGTGLGSTPTSDRLSGLIRNSVGAQQESEFKVEVNDLLSEVLREANSRDSDALNTKIEVIEDALADLLEESVELRYGGSVSKHTYVDGLSDVDVLVILRRDAAVDQSPKQLLADFGEAIRSRVREASVKVGTLAVTVRFDDGLEIQLLPAFRAAGGYRISRPLGETWSGVIRPKDFAEKLTSCNQRLSGNVVPTIKLFKIAQDRLPESERLSGYHIEALAIDAFAGYEGPLDRKEMFMHLAREAARMLPTPVPEPTGQSTYVDSYLGPAEGPKRRRVSERIDRLVRKLETASERGDIETWRQTFEQ